MMSGHQREDVRTTKQGFRLLIAGVTPLSNKPSDFLSAAEIAIMWSYRDPFPPLGRKRNGRVAARLSHLYASYTRETPWSTAQRSAGALSLLTRGTSHQQTHPFHAFLFPATHTSRRRPPASWASPVARRGARVRLTPCWGRHGRPGADRRP